MTRMTTRRSSRPRVSSSRKRSSNSGSRMPVAAMARSSSSWPSSSLPMADAEGRGQADEHGRLGKTDAALVAGDHPMLASELASELFLAPAATPAQTAYAFSESVAERCIELCTHRKGAIRQPPLRIAATWRWPLRRTAASVRLSLSSRGGPVARLWGGALVGRSSWKSFCRYCRVRILGAVRRAVENHSAKFFRGRPRSNRDRITLRRPPCGARSAKRPWRASSPC